MSREHHAWRSLSRTGRQVAAVGAVVALAVGLLVLALLLGYRLD